VENIPLPGAAATLEDWAVCAILTGSCAYPLPLRPPCS